MTHRVFSNCQSLETEKQGNRGLWKVPSVKKIYYLLQKGSFERRKTLDINNVVDRIRGQKRESTGDAEWIHNGDCNIHSMSVGDWFQEAPRIAKSMDAQVAYVKWYNTCTEPRQSSRILYYLKMCLFI